VVGTLDGILAGRLAVAYKQAQVYMPLELADGKHCRKHRKHLQDLA